MPSLTYAELAKALKITPESANRLARRKRWSRMRGNDGKTRVTVPEEELVRPVSPPASPDDSRSDSPPDSPQDNPILAQIARLEGELIGMHEALAEARARASTAEARLADVDAHHAVELVSERARADTAIGGFEALLRTESERADRAIAAFESLAARLEAMAEAKRPSWWRWLRFAD